MQDSPAAEMWNDSSKNGSEYIGHREHTGNAGAHEMPLVCWNDLMDANEGKTVQTGAADSLKCPHYNPVVCFVKRSCALDGWTLGYVFKSDVQLSHSLRNTTAKREECKD